MGRGCVGSHGRDHAHSGGDDNATTAVTLLASDALGVGAYSGAQALAAVGGDGLCFAASLTFVGGAARFCAGRRPAHRGCGVAHARSSGAVRRNENQELQGHAAFVRSGYHSESQDVR